ncbi:hypothetical protein [Thioalkalivibrio sulfidiphilus]|uniref:hypothetical protein n=1 Tax=Thioalkalivibrio sulfidiphilus TaxID=1033854 RepID=UPI0012DC8E01|nr:hypothetical protein [Thioalkalivibrio sulfidiphilus]
MDKNQLKIDIEPKRIIITSEPYVMYTKRGYQAVVDVIESRSKRDYFIYISARSLSDRLEELRLMNNNKLHGLEIWVRKESAEKMAGYIVEE